MNYSIHVTFKQRCWKGGQEACSGAMRGTKRRVVTNFRDTLRQTLWNPGLVVLHDHAARALVNVWHPFLTRLHRRLVLVSKWPTPCFHKSALSFDHSWRLRIFLFCELFDKQPITRSKASSEPTRTTASEFLKEIYLTGSINFRKCGFRPRNFRPTWP